MSLVMKSSGASILIGLYLIIIIESATLGLLVKYTGQTYLKYSRTTAKERDTNSVLLLTFIVVAVIGHLLTIPCLCFGTQTHRAPPLVPYLVWRMFLSIQAIILVLWQSNVDANRLSPSTFYDHILPIGLSSALVGVVFFGIAMRAHREFYTRRMLIQQQHRTSVQEAYTHLA